MQKKKEEKEKVFFENQNNKLKDTIKLHKSSDNSLQVYR